MSKVKRNLVAVEPIPTEPEVISEIDLSNLKLAERMYEAAKIQLIKTEGAVEFQHHAIRLRYGLSETDTIDNGGIIKRA